MSGITTARSIRFATLDDPISAAFLEDTAKDIARELDAADVLKTAAMKRPCAMVHTDTFTVAVSTVTTVNFTTEDVDTHAMVNLGTNAQRITVSSSSGAGLYYVTAFSEAFDSSAWTMGEFTITKNGTGQVRRKYYNYNGSTTLKMHVSGIIHLGTVGDYVDLRVYHEGGGTDNLSSTWLKAFKITIN